MSFIAKAQAASVSHAVDTGAAVSIFAVLAGWLPGIVAVLAMLWYILQIWESQTVRDWRAKWRSKHDQSDPTS